MNSVTSFLLLIFCVGLIVSTTIPADKNATFQLNFNNGITEIKPNLTYLVNQIFIQNVDPVSITTNRQYFLDVATIIANYLDDDMNVMRIDLANKILADYECCLTDFDIYYDQHIANMIDGPECESNTIIARLNGTFEKGIAACGDCFESVSGLIFPAFGLYINDANEQVSLYGPAALDCNSSLHSDPDCYFKTNGPGIYYEAATIAINNVFSCMDYGILKSVEPDFDRSDCSVNTQNNGFNSFAGVVDDYAQCFS